MSNGRWKPEHGDIYYYISESLTVEVDSNNDTFTDKERIYCGNRFKTEEEAEYAARLVRDLLKSIVMPPTVYDCRPKLTVDVFNSPDCPEWAKYAAVDSDGEARYHKLKPVVSEYWWFSTGKAKAVNCGRFNATDWQNSLIERSTKNLPKLTAEVFDRPDCPAWAKYAAVDEDGMVVLFERRPTIAYFGRWWDRKDKYCPLDGRYDSSDWQNSLIERPTELPGWCKAGAWVYSTVYKEYVRIKDTDEFDVEFDRGAYCTVSHKSFMEDYKPASIRPYNADEMRGLVGKVICRGPSVHFVTGYEDVLDGESMVHVNGCLYSANDLLQKGFTYDTKPCGRLEHLENGEWVE